MTWVAVNKDGTELISQEPLKRDSVSKRWFPANIRLHYSTSLCIMNAK